MSLIACAECGSRISSRAVACPHCGCPADVAVNKQSNNNTSFKYKGQIYDFAKVEAIISSKEDWVVDVMVVLLNEYKFSKNDTVEICDIIKMYGNKIPEDFQKDKDNKKQEYYANSMNKCPKCGSTQFTPVRKKFSLLTGFATNKVEMVCNNCGTVRK